MKNVGKNFREKNASEKSENKCNEKIVQTDLKSGFRIWDFENAEPILDLFFVVVISSILFIIPEFSSFQKDS